MSTDTQLLRPEQVAERLQVSEYTAVKWLRQGRIKGRKLGKFWRVKADDLEAFINQPPTLTLVDAPAAPTLAASAPGPKVSQAQPANGTPVPPAPPAAPTLQMRRAALLARIQAMHAEGLSTQAIATGLNQEGVPTISGRGQWQRGTVANLLAQAEGTPC